MPKQTPAVRRNHLYPDPQSNAEALCALDSPTWFAWLESATQFRYYTTRRFQVAQAYWRTMRPISVRKEKRRSGFLWYANLRVHGVLYKRYVGRSAALTVEHLDRIATLLNEVW